MRKKMKRLIAGLLLIAIVLVSVEGQNVYAEEKTSIICEQDDFDCEQESLILQNEESELIQVQQTEVQTEDELETDSEQITSENESDTIEEDDDLAVEITKDVSQNTGEEQELITDGDIVFREGTLMRQRLENGKVSIIWYSVAAGSGLGDLLMDGKPMDHICYIQIQSGDSWYPAYCVQHTAPLRNGNQVATGGHALSEKQKQKIGTILCYLPSLSVYSTDISKAPSKTDFAKYTASQISIWLVTCNKYGTEEGDKIAEKVCNKSKQQKEGESYQYYLDLKKAVYMHDVHPSFTTESDDASKVYEMEFDTVSQQYQLVLTDLNDCLMDYSLSGIDGLNYEIKDDKLYLTSAKPIEEEMLIQMSKQKYNEQQAYQLWYNPEDDAQQELVTLAERNKLSKNVYLKIKTTGGMSSLTLKKVSLFPEMTEDNDEYSKKGAVYGVYTDALCENLIASLTTDTDGNTEAYPLPRGTYYVKEIEAPKGFKVDKEIYEVVLDNADGQILSVEETPLVFEETLFVKKVDVATGNDAQNGLTLDQAVFKISYYKGTYSEEHLPEKADRSWLVKSSFNKNKNGYYAELTPDEVLDGDELFYVNDTCILPLGTITIEEIEAPVGYNVENVCFSSEDGTIQCSEKYITSVTAKNNLSALIIGGNEVVASDRIIRGDFEFLKKDAESGEAMSEIPFEIKNEKTGETHIIYTDEDGFFSSKKTKLPDNTLLSFGKEEVSGNYGACPYGAYTIRELACDKNYNKVLYTGEFNISRQNELIQIGTILNRNIIVSTEALNQKTGNHYACKEKEVCIEDTVMYRGLDIGETYRLEATLMDRDSKKEIVDNNNNPIKTDVLFTAEKTDGNQCVTIRFNADNMDLNQCVVFERLYKQDILIGEHCDLDDQSQMIIFPSIETSLTDDDYQSHISLATDHVILNDRVEYHGLEKGKEYQLKGILMDQQTGEEVLDQNGSRIEAQTSFVAESEEGDVNVVFSFDGEGIAGKAVVAFETLLRDEKVYAVHADIKDHSQTVYLPIIQTSASDGKTGQHIGLGEQSVDIIDDITYSGLIPNETYHIKGKIIDINQEKDLLLAGQLVEAEVEFVAEASFGTKQVEFNFNETMPAGSKLVIFEELWFGEQLIAEHKSLMDENQMIFYPLIKTNAEEYQSKLKVCDRSKETIVVDHVYYQYLPVNQTYQLRGRLVDPESGKDILIDGKAVTSNLEFSPDTEEGTADIFFKFDSTKLTQSKVVIVEELVYEDQIVAVHEDLQDVNQTICFSVTESPKINKFTPSTDDATPLAALGTLGGISLALCIVLWKKRKGYHIGE